MVCKFVLCLMSSDDTTNRKSSHVVFLIQTTDQSLIGVAQLRKQKKNNVDTKQRTKYNLEQLYLFRKKCLKNGACIPSSKDK